MEDQEEGPQSDFADGFVQAFRIFLVLMEHIGATWRTIYDGHQNCLTKESFVFKLLGSFPGHMQGGQTVTRIKDRLAPSNVLSNQANQGCFYAEINCESQGSLIR